jgi:hypothetical protein
MDKEAFKKVLAATDGWKTYALCIAGIIVVLLDQFVTTVPGTGGGSPEWLTSIFQLVLVMTGRRALSELKPSTPT